MIKNLNLIFKKKTIYKIIFNFLVFFIIIVFTYFSIPYFFNYSSQLIEENFKTNNDINIKNISKINYKAFPNPRLEVHGSNLYLKENILEIDGSEIVIILNPSKILNNKKLYYSKIIIKGGSTKIKTNNINKLSNYFKKKKLKIFLKKNNLIFIRNKKSLFEINNSIVEIRPSNNQKRLRVNGIFLNHKITFLLKSQLENGNNIIIKIPELDILSRIFLTNKDSLSFFNGFVNLQVLNNFFKFNFTKEKNIKINEGFVRNNIINSSFEGEVTINPNFLLNLTFEPTVLNMEKLLPIIQKKYFSDNVDIELIKKINGSFIFKRMTQGVVTFKNGEILFSNFQSGSNDSLFFNARISEFGKKGKIYFDVLKTIQYRKSSPKELKISGFIHPSSSKIFFEQLLFNEKDYTQEDVKVLQKNFNNEVIQKSLSNIFNYSKLNNFFNNFKN